MNRKTPLLFAIVFVLGIAIGWIFRGTSLATVAAGSETATVTSKDREGQNAEAHPADNDFSPAPRTKANREREEITEKPSAVSVDLNSKEMRARIAKATADRQRAVIEPQIAKLVDALSLTPRQRADLTASMENELAKIATGDGTDMIAGMGQSLTTKALEEKIAANLTEEQKAAYEEFKERRTAAQVDAKALKTLAQMQAAIDFEEGQRDAVYKILSEDAEASVTQENPGQFAAMVNGIGLDMDPYDIGLDEAMAEAMAGSPRGPGQAEHDAYTKRLNDALEKRIDAKVERLRPVLNEKQLEQYRAEIRSKSQGVGGGGFSVGGGAIINFSTTSSVEPQE